MAALFTAFDISTLSTNTEASLVIGVTITLGFVGYKVIKRIVRAL